VSDRGPGRSVRLAWGAVIVILLGAVGLVTYALTHVSSPAAVAQTSRTSPAIVGSLSTIPAATFDAVGATVPGVELTAPQVLSGQPALTAQGRPLVLFVGSEFCPFCAAERWPLVVALARFGRFTELHDATSSSQSVFPDTATFSFAGAQYTSPYLTFTGIERYSDQVGADGSFTRVARLTSAQAALVAHYSCAGSPAATCTAPFVDIGGRMVATTSGFSPALLAGLSQAQIAGMVAQPPQSTSPPTTLATPPVGQAVLAAANQLSAGMCAATGQRPSAVCRSKGVRTADDSLGITVAGG
jgi:hypothetical protein